MPEKVRRESLINKYSFKKALMFSIPILVLVAGVFIRSTNLISVNLVKGQSMEPTLYEGNILLGSSIPVMRRDIDHGDIVVLEADNNGKTLIIKRVIGIPGDTIEIRDGKVYLNDELLIEDYIKHEEKEISYNISKTLLTEDQYWVMGDNRMHSSDSRLYGAFSIKDIKSKILFK